MKRSVFLLAAVMATIGVFSQKATTMREAFADKFLIGTALNTRQVVSRDKALQALIKDNFSAVVAENCMKAEVLQPQEGVFNFKDGDRLCDLAEKKWAGGYWPLLDMAFSSPSVVFQGQRR